MVEAIIAISMLILLYAGALFFHRLYSAKLSTIQNARQTAWSSAMPGCGGGGLGIRSIFGDIAQGDIGDMPDQQSPGFLHIGAGDVTPDSESVPSSPLLGGGTFDVSTATRFVCNETPKQYNDILSVGQWIAGLFIP